MEVHNKRQESKGETMPLEFKETEAVKFGNITAVPEMDAELKLRISRLKFRTEEDTSEAIQLMSKAFGEKAIDVREFMTKHMGQTQLQKLQAYLVGGEDGLNLYEKQLERLTNKMIDDAMEGNNG